LIYTAIVSNSAMADFINKSGYSESSWKNLPS